MALASLAWSTPPAKREVLHREAVPVFRNNVSDVEDAPTLHEVPRVATKGGQVAPLGTVQWEGEADQQMPLSGR